SQCIAGFRATQRTKIVHQMAGILGKVQRSQLGVMHIHFSRRFSPWSEVEYDLDTVDETTLDGFGNEDCGWNETITSTANGLAESAVDVGHHARFHGPAELKQRSAPH